MDKPFILGVDPGLSGAVALYNSEAKAIYAMFQMPLVVTNESGRKDIAIRDLALWIVDHAHRIRFAVVEAVSARPGQGVTSMFRFGHSLGLVEGILGTCAITTVKVPPSSWKLLMHCNQDKKKSQRLAAELFPTKAEEFLKPKADGLAEAALLAVYGSLYVGVE